MSTQLEFCTYFDSHYMVRGLALYESLAEWCRNVRLWVLCLDDECFEAVKAYGRPNIVPVRLAELEAADPDLLACRSNRSRVEYYFTCTSCLPLFVFAVAKDVQLLTYVDADVFFFANPSDVFDEIGGKSIAIVEHRFPAHARHRERFGRFNVGWISFRRDQEGLACLRRWREECLEWCGDRPEPDRFADQKYLDRWPELFRGVHVVAHKGANLAPWNLETYRVHGRDRRVWVDDQPLVFFHFHGLKEKRRFVYDTSLDEYGVTPSAVVVRDIYRPYIKALERIRARAARRAGSALGSGVRGQPRTATPSRIREWRDLIKGRYLVIWNGCVLSAGRQGRSN